jgi:hypothetical protein
MADGKPIITIPKCWTRKPPQGTALNPAHPAYQHIENFIRIDQIGSLDLKDGSTVITDSSTRQSTPEGIGLDSTDTNNFTIPISGFPDYGGVLLITYRTDVGIGNHDEYHLGNSGFLSRFGSTENITIRTGTNTMTDQVVAPIIFGATGRQNLLGLWQNAGSPDNREVWLNGQKAFSSTTGFGTPGTPGTVLNLHGGVNRGRSLLAAVYFTGDIAPYAKSLTENPWQLFQPRRVFIIDDPDPNELVVF